MNATPTLQRKIDSTDGTAVPPKVRRRRVAPLLVTIAPTSIVVFLVLLSHPRRLYTSDSTAQQSIVRTWLDVGHDLTFVPRDSWALKVPLYLVVERLPLPPLDKLLIVVLTVNVLTFLILGWAVWVLARGTTADARWHEVTVPLIWLVAIGGGIGDYRMTPNYRNVELGLGFLMLALTALYLGNKTRPIPTPRQGAVGVLAALLIGVLGFDDPYITLLIAGPLAAAALGWYLLRARDRRLLLLAAVMAGSFAMTAGLRALAGTQGIRFDDDLPTLAVAPADLSMHLGLLPESTNVLLGTGNWDGPALSLLAQALVIVVIAILLVASIVLACWGWRRQRFVVTFVAAHWPLVLAGFLVSWHTRDPSAGRYLVLAVFDLAVAAAIFLPVLRRKRRAWSTALIGLLSISAAAGLANATVTGIERNGRPDRLLNHQQAVVEAVERAVEDHGALKGYAPFWSANITTYLVGQTTTAAEVTCRDGQLRSRQWLSDTARFTRPARSVFLIWDPVALAGCPSSVRDAQLGQPIAEYRVTEPPQAYGPGAGAVSVLVYSPDISSRLPDQAGRTPDPVVRQQTSTAPGSP